MKQVVTEDNYKPVVLKRMITLCWVLLGICFVVKLFGGNFFAFVGESAFIDFIVNHRWLLCIVQSIVYIFGTYMIFIIMLENKYRTLSLIMAIVMAISKQLIDLGTLFYIISFSVEFMCLLLIPTLIHPDKIFYILVVNIAVVIFQLISLVTKDIGLISFPYEDVVGFVYMIDYYIMLFLSSLYIIKGDVNTMKLCVWFLSKDTTQLEAYKGILKDKYEKKVAKIDAKIEKNNKKK